MIPCFPDHIKNSECPECDIVHSEYSSFPDEPITVNECNELEREAGIDMVLPIFRVEDTDEQGYYVQVVPAVVAIEKNIVRVLWCNPSSDDGWIIVSEHETPMPYELARELRNTLRESAQLERTIAGHDVIEEPLTAE
jgi:hypothetical protein